MYMLWPEAHNPTCILWVPLRLIGDGKRDHILSTNFSHRPFLLVNILKFASAITDKFVSRGE